MTDKQIEEYDKERLLRLYLLVEINELYPEAYGVPLRQRVEARWGKRLSYGKLYAVLDELERKGVIRSWNGEPVPERGGRPKRFYEIQLRSEK